MYASCLNKLLPLHDGGMGKYPDADRAWQCGENSTRQRRSPFSTKDGKPVTETVEVTRPAFKVVSVFDVSQTDGKELPDIAVDELTGSVENYAAF